MTPHQEGFEAFRKGVEENPYEGKDKGKEEQWARG